MVVGIAPMSALSVAPDLAKNAAAVNPVRARARCTDVLAAFDATEMHVATAADRCALHCHTHQGTVVIRLPLAVLVQRARGSLDGNGHPFPVVEAGDAKIARLAHECATPLTPPRVFPGRALRPEIAAAYQAAFTDFLSGVVGTKRAALLRHLPETRYGAFTAWCNHDAQLAFAAAYRRPVLKPSGAIA